MSTFTRKTAVTTQDLATRSGLIYCSSRCIIDSFFLHHYRKVKSAPADGHFDVDWVDAGSVSCAPSKLVKVPPVNQVFTRNKKHYKVIDYQKGKVLLGIIPDKDLTNANVATRSLRSRSKTKAPKTPQKQVRVYLRFIYVCTCSFYA